MDTVTLISSDGDEFVIPKRVALMSTTIAYQLEVGPTIPLEHIRTATLVKVIEWASYRIDNPLVFFDKDDKYKVNFTDAWDDAFLKAMDMATLFDVIMAANFLDVQGLLKLCCIAVARMIEGCTPEELHEKFLLPEYKTQ